jgi:hypothetical protein
VDRGKVSTVRVGSDRSIFVLGERDGDFAAEVERADLAYRLEIRLLS